MRVMPIPAAVVLLSLASVSPSRAVYQEPHPTREQLRALPLMTEIVVALRSGESVSGALAEVTENDFGLWVDPANDLRHQYPLAQKVMRHIDYEDVEQIVAPDLTRRPPPMSKWWGIGFTYGSTHFTSGGRVTEPSERRFISRSPTDWASSRRSATRTFPLSVLAASSKTGH